MVTLGELNACSAAEFIDTLRGVYESSPWIPERAEIHRPFASVNALKLALQTVVGAASRSDQLALIRAHPDLAGKAAVNGDLSDESAAEQSQSGLDRCKPEEFAMLQKLNADYRGKFDFPFILAIKGPDGKGLNRQAIIATFCRRMKNQIDDEFAENLRQIDRIAELRLNQLLEFQPQLGEAVLAQCDVMAAWSDDIDSLTCAYMTDAHRKTAAQLQLWMQEAGMQTHVDAVGNVAGIYKSDLADAKTLMTGSHYDTVRNGGKYDGRAGILLPIAAIKHLHERGEKLPFHVEVVAFSEEEGLRFKSAFLGSAAITGSFDRSLLDRRDENGVSMRTALKNAGHDVATIPGIARNAADLLGFVEVHIEQGPVLLQRGLPAGIVTSVAGSSRYLIELTGVAGHAGTTPMTMRKDAAAAAAEIVLLVERRCGRSPSLVGTVGQLVVPNGSVNVIPGSCRLSLDIRAADDAMRETAVSDILREIDAICVRRNVDRSIDLTMNVKAAPCSPRLMQQLCAAAERLGIPAFELSSGAGHDAMMLARITEIAMLFIRCGNGGISHNPLETMTADDADIAARIFLDFLRHFAT